MPKILSTPKNGWSNFKFDKDARISYVDEMPMILLEEILQALESNKPFCITLDAEGYDYTILSYDNENMEYILRKEKVSINSLNFSFKEFVLCCIDDIENDIKEWVNFQEFLEENKPKEETIIKYIEKIRKLL